MTDSAASSRRPTGQRKRLVREAILDAAEGLLENPSDFSMRALAQAAGVSFTTPFKHFGSKEGILMAIAVRRIEVIIARYEAAAPVGDAITRMFFMADLGAEVYLERPELHRQSITAWMLHDDNSSDTASHKIGRELCQMALGDCDGIDPSALPLARLALADQLTMMWRGALMLWLIRALDDRQVRSAFRSGVATVMLGFAPPDRRPMLERTIVEAMRDLNPAARQTSQDQ